MTSLAVAQVCPRTPMGGKELPRRARTIEVVGVDVGAWSGEHEGTAKPSN